MPTSKWSNSPMHPPTDDEMQIYVTANVFGNQFTKLVSISVDGYTSETSLMGKLTKVLSEISKRNAPHGITEDEYDISNLYLYDDQTGSWNTFLGGVLKPYQLVAIQTDSIWHSSVPVQILSVPSPQPSYSFDTWILARYLYFTICKDTAAVSVTDVQMAFSKLGVSFMDLLKDVHWSKSLSFPDWETLFLTCSKQTITDLRRGLSRDSSITSNSKLVSALHLPTTSTLLSDTSITVEKQDIESEGIKKVTYVSKKPTVEDELEQKLKAVKNRREGGSHDAQKPPKEMTIDDQLALAVRQVRSHRQTGHLVGSTSPVVPIVEDYDTRTSNDTVDDELARAVKKVRRQRETGNFSQSQSPVRRSQPAGVRLPFDSNNNNCKQDTIDDKLALAVQKARRQREEMTDGANKEENVDDQLARAVQIARQKRETGTFSDQPTAAVTLPVEVIPPNESVDDKLARAVRNFRQKRESGKLTEPPITTSSHLKTAEPKGYSAKSASPAESFSSASTNTILTIKRSDSQQLLPGSRNHTPRGIDDELESKLQSLRTQRERLTASNIKPVDDEQNKQPELVKSQKLIVPPKTANDVVVTTNSNTTSIDDDLSQRLKEVRSRRENISQTHPQPIEAATASTETDDHYNHITYKKNILDIQTAPEGGIDAKIQSLESMLQISQSQSGSSRRSSLLTSADESFTAPKIASDATSLEPLKSTDISNPSSASQPTRHPPLPAESTCTAKSVSVSAEEGAPTNWSDEIDSLEAAVQKARARRLALTETT
eukprot:TRINITY_DN1653_c2_g1_i1.p1 TRINITY_DN1653_c2_g1~~TRINITY_DN1653_c2_g1_i1.p1  ORF type:complete len:773 (+),score=139.62 TRINITY_DN1653_c2_g1_i1:66-2384(+)